MGLFIGVELVTDRTTKQPAAEEARRVIYMWVWKLPVHCGD